MDSMIFFLFLYISLLIINFISIFGGGMILDPNTVVFFSLLWSCHN